MDSPGSFVEHAERLTSIFGYWPSFHDAEVIELHLWRGEIDPDRERYVFPTLTVKLHLWEMPGKTDERGFLLLWHHTLASLRLHGLEEAFELSGFNHANELCALTIEQRRRDNGPSPFLAVEFESGFGMGARFACQRAEVLEAIPCDDAGNPL